MEPDDLLKRLEDLSEPELRKVFETAGRLLESTSEDNEVQAAWNTEIRKRIKELESGEVKGIPGRRP